MGPQMVYFRDTDSNRKFHKVQNRRTETGETVGVENRSVSLRRGKSLMFLE